MKPKTVDRSENTWTPFWNNERPGLIQQQPFVLKNYLNTPNRHTGGSREWAFEASGSHDKIPCRIWDPAGFCGNKCRVHDPAGSHDKNADWINDLVMSLNPKIIAMKKIEL